MEEDQDQLPVEQSDQGAPTGLGHVAPEPERHDVISTIVARAADGSAQRVAQVAALQSEIADLEAERKQLDKVAETFGQVADAAAAAHPGEALRLLRRASKARDQVVERDPALKVVLDEREAALLEQASAAAEALSRTLPPAISERGLQLDAGSRFPRFTLRDAYFEVKVDVRKAEATLSTRGGSRTKVAVDADVLADEILAADQRVFRRDVDRADVLARIEAVFDQCRAESATESVPVEAVMDALKQVDKSFSVDAFLVDLEALVYGEQPARPGGPTVQLDSTKDTKRGVLLPGHEMTGYKGYMRLVVGGEPDGSAGHHPG